MLDPTWLAEDEELLRKHMMIKWEGESSMKPASFCTMLWYDERSFPRGTNWFLLFLTRSREAEAVEQVSSVAWASVLTSKERSSLPMRLMG